jgi:S-adenosylmethionine:diacylglycerol 3-amino-3-carboxypropyl transferase
MNAMSRLAVAHFSFIRCILPSPVFFDHVGEIGHLMTLDGPEWMTLKRLNLFIKTLGRGKPLR